MPHLVKMIGSGNSLAAICQVFPQFQTGGSAMDACVAAATLVENDPEEITVGYGGLPNADGIVELDAAVMDGRLGRAGAVAGLQNIRNPTQVARLVLEQTERVLLVGEGALRFARMHGFSEENLLTENSRRLWGLWMRRRDNAGNYPCLLSDPRDSDLLQKYPTLFERLPTGTVHIAALDSSGNLACATSTSGHAFKLPGRVGDSAIVGAGLYVENGVGSCGSVGCGEANMQNLTSYAIVRSLRQLECFEEAATKEAALAVHQHQRRLVAAKRSPEDLDVRYFILTQSGQHLGLSVQKEQSIAVVDDSGGRLEKCKTLNVKQEIDQTAAIILRNHAF